MGRISYPETSVNYPSILHKIPEKSWHWNHHQALSKNIDPLHRAIKTRYGIQTVHNHFMFTTHVFVFKLFDLDNCFNFKILKPCYVWLLCLYRVSQQECARLWESVPYVKVYRYNPKHLCPKLNGNGDNGQRKVWSSCGSTYCTCSTDAVEVHYACPLDWNADNIVQS